MEQPPLSEAQKELLVVLLTADRKARMKSEGRKGDTFAWHSTGGMGPTYLLHRGAEENQEVDGTEMEALIACGLLKRVGRRSAVFTPSGAQIAVRIEHERTQALGVDPSWSAIKPVLDALWAEWVAVGAPGHGVSGDRVAEVVDDNPQRVDRQLELLERGGWLMLTTHGAGFRAEGSTYAPTPQTLELLGGWPTPSESVAQQFLAALAITAEQTEDPEEKSRLRELAEAAARVGESTLAGVLTKLATGSIPDF